MVQKSDAFLPFPYCNRAQDTISLTFLLECRWLLVVSYRLIQ